MINAVPDRVAAVRRDGVAAMTLDRGLPAVGAAATCPGCWPAPRPCPTRSIWPSLRHAARTGRRRRHLRQLRRLHTGGAALDGGDRHRRADGNPALLTPPPWYPILRGTTQQALFEVARKRATTATTAPCRTADLFAAQGIWLVSSMTLAPVCTLSTAASCRVPRSPPSSPNWWTPPSSAIADREFCCPRHEERVSSAVHRKGGGPQIDSFMDM